MKKIIFAFVAIFSFSFSAFAYDVEEAWSKLKKDDYVLHFSEVSPAEAAKAGFTTLFISETFPSESVIGILSHGTFEEIDDIYKVVKSSVSLSDVVARQEDGEGKYNVVCYLDQGKGEDRSFVIMYGKMTKAQLNTFLKSFKK